MKKDFEYFGCEVFLLLFVFGKSEQQSVSGPNGSLDGVIGRDRFPKGKFTNGLDFSCYGEHFGRTVQ